MWEDHDRLMMSILNRHQAHKDTAMREAIKRMFVIVGIVGLFSTAVESIIEYDSILGLLYSDNQYIVGGVFTLLLGFMVLVSLSAQLITKSVKWMSFSYFSVLFIILMYFLYGYLNWYEGRGWALFLGAFLLMYSILAYPLLVIKIPLSLVFFSLLCYLLWIPLAIIGLSSVGYF